MLIGRNIFIVFQLFEVIYGEVDELWVEKYKFGWMIIGLVCLDKIVFYEFIFEVLVNRVIVMREELFVYNLGSVLVFQIFYFNRQVDVNEGYDVFLIDL